MSDPSGTIRRLAGEAELVQCARMMAESEPWITLGRTLEASLGNLRDPGKEVSVIEEAGQIRGFVVVDLRGPFSGYVQSICVHPDARGRGYGTRLIAWAEQRIFRETPNVFLCVSDFNPDARRLYERLGYTVVGQLPDYIVRGHSEILFRKSRGPWSEYRE